MGKVEIGIYFCVTADILTKNLQKCSWSSPLPTIWILSKSLILIGGHGNRKAKFLKKHSKIFFLEAIWGMKLKFCIHVHDISLYINYVLYYCCPFAFVAIATWSFDRLIMGKVEIGICFCITADILREVLQKCFGVVLYQPHKFCPNRWFWLVAMATERLNFLRSHKGDEAETLHKCLWY